MMCVVVPPADIHPVEVGVEIEHCPPGNVANRRPHNGHHVEDTCADHHVRIHGQNDGNVQVKRRYARESGN